nr:hypothetical protein LTR18_010219 [Exophiala xenobiotica]
MASQDNTNSQGLPTVHLLVMGMTGSGKSTFIQRATGDISIETGGGLLSVTREVKSYPVVHKGYEIFLIDSPGFDDDSLSDDDVLKKIADFVNNIHNLNWTIGGIIYLHDISQARLRNTGTINIRVLETFAGRENWNNLSLVTNKWSDPKKPDELLREQQLQEHPRFWAEMCNAGGRARMCRFDNTEATAKQIIEWHLGKNFVPQISRQMVDQRVALGDTDAGQVLRERYEALFTQQGLTEKLAQMNERMESTFDGMQTQIAIDKLLRDLRKLEQKRMLQRVGSWVVRLATYGGAMVATVLTENPAAFRAALAAAGPLEMSFKKMKGRTESQADEIRRSIASTAFFGQLGSSGQVTELGDE